MHKHNSLIHPVYVVSKGRYASLMTSIALTKMAVPHFLVVEPQELAQYRAAVADKGVCATVLELDLAYKTTYELCDGLGQARSTGPGPARNFAWEHSVREGAAWHWVMDDNIAGFFRLNENRKYRCLSPAPLRAMEKFSNRYVNVAMAGPNYMFFVIARQKYPPFYSNTRIYSCNLIRNDVPFRWRGRYNEDTILSIDMLKAGWCTVEFNAFLQDKQPTQTMGGGNTAEFYHREGTVGSGAYANGGTTAKSEMLARVHPDVAKVVTRYGRVHHYVNYQGFKQRLVYRRGVELSTGTDNFGMVLERT